MDSNIHPLLKTYPAFAYPSCLAESSAATRDAIFAGAVQRCFQPGEIVFLEGQPCAGLYIVESGWLKGVITSPLGREQVVRLAGPGEMVNETGAVVGGPNLVTFQALEAATVWVIERRRVIALMEDYPDFCKIITRNLAERVVQLLQLVEDLSLCNVEGRLARLLLDRSTEDVVHRRRWSTQAEMAAYIGTTPEVINRVLNDMVAEGLIHVERHKIQIYDRCALERKARAEYK